MTAASLRTRLLSRAVINWETGCWEWTGDKTSSDYGRLVVDGVNRAAHRIAYELLVGPIPDGLQLDHLCRVRRCINPAHLEPVTSRENTLRSPITLASLQLARTHCPAGHEYNEANTRIRRGKRSCLACAADYNERRRQVRAEMRADVERLAAELVAAAERLCANHGTHALPSVVSLAAVRRAARRNNDAERAA